MVTSLIRPSYHQGFARNANQCKPEDRHLWDSKELHICPALGITGLGKLRDFSGFKRHGTLSGSMTMADWIRIEDNIVVLDTDASNDHIDVGTLPVSTWSAISIAILFDLTSTLANQRIFAIQYSGSDDIRLVVRGSGAQVRFTMDDGNTSGEQTASIPSGLVFVVCTHDGSTQRLFIDASEPDAPNAKSYDYAGTGGATTISSFGASNHTGIRLHSCRIYNRAVRLKEVIKLKNDPMAELRLRRPIWKPSAAAPAVLLRTLALTGAGK